MGMPPRKGAIAVCSRNVVGVITSEQPETPKQQAKVTGLW